MKKNDKISWAIYLMAGVVMIAVGLKLDIEYYSTLIFAIGVSFRGERSRTDRGALVPHEAR